MIKIISRVASNFFILSILLSPIAVMAQLNTVQGGTGTTSPSGILYGDGTLHLKTVGIGTNCTFIGGVFNCSGGGGSAYPFPLTGNATSTLTQFNGGLTAYASSTIGNGILGLTVNGTASSSAIYSGPPVSSFDPALYSEGAFSSRSTISDLNPSFDTAATIGMVQEVDGDNKSSFGTFNVSFITGEGSNATGLQEVAQAHGTKNSNSLTGGQFEVDNGSTGITTTGTPIVVTGANQLLGGTGWFTNWTGIDVQDTEMATNVAGIKINQAASSTDSNYFSLKSIGTAPSYFIGNLGVGTTTPGTLFSLGNTGGINFDPTATSTWGTSANGINLNNGCFAVKGVCVGTGAGTVTSVTGTYPVQSTGGVTPAISLAFGTTTTNIWSNQQTFTNGFLSTASSTINASSTITGALTLTGATTTASGGGFNVTNGCFAYNGACLTAGAIGGGFTSAANWAATTTLAGTPTYANGTAGVGATLTEVGTGALYVDGNNPALGDRVLVKNQTSAIQNGIYTVTVTGSGIASYVLTRATDYNSPTEITPGLNTYVISGTANSDSTWAVNFTPPLSIGVAGNNLNYTESAGNGVTSVSGTTNQITSSGGTTPTLSLPSLVIFPGQASTTQLSATRAYFGGSSTTTIDTSGNVVIPSGATLTNTGVSDGCGTFASGVLSSTGSACGTSSLVTYLAFVYSTSTQGTTTVRFTGAANSNPSFTSTSASGTLQLPSNTSYFTVEGHGGGGGGGATTTNNGTNGAASCFNQGLIACGAGALINAGGGNGGGVAGGTPGVGGVPLAGAIQMNGQTGMGEANSAQAPQSNGGSSPRGGLGGFGLTTTGIGANGTGPGGGGSGGRNGTTASGTGGGGGAYAMQTATTSPLTTSNFVVGSGGPGGGFLQAGGNGANGDIVINVYIAK